MFPFYIGVLVVAICLCLLIAIKRNQGTIQDSNSNDDSTATSQGPAMSSVRMPERTETTDQLPLYVPRPPLPTSYSNLPPLETEQGTYSTPPSYTDAIKGTEPQSNPIVDSNLTEVPLTTTITIPETSYYPENVPERNHSVGVAVQ